MAKKRIKNDLELVFGLEPKFDPKKISKKNYNSVLGDALRWYGEFGGAGSSKSLRNFHNQWLKDWALANGIRKGSFAVPNQGIRSLGSLARAATKGFPINEKHKGILVEAFASWKPAKKAKIDREAVGRLVALKAKIKNDEAITPVLTIFDNAIDSVIDGEKSWTVKTSASLNGKQTNEVLAIYKGALKELKVAYSKKDEELVEAYPYARMVLRRLVQVHEDILVEIESCSLKGVVVKKARAPRAKKVKPASALVSKLKFMPVHSSYNLTSVDPEKIVGAEVVYVFDAKKRVLKRFEATGVDGIGVKGTTLQNINTQQKVIRKPELQLSGFGSLPKLKANKAFEAIRAKTKECTGRMNKDSIILRIF